MNTIQTKRQVALAKSIGVTREHLNAVLRRRVHPSVKLAKKIEAATGTPWQSWFDSPSDAPTTPPQDAA